MGLFKKKPMPSPDETPAGGMPATDSKKKPKASVDPVDFLNLRAEMLDLRARLEAAEQAKAVVEARLAALDATTTALSTERLGGDDVRSRIDELEAQFEAQAQPTWQTDAQPAGVDTVVITTEPDPELLIRLDELAARVDQVAAAQIEAAHAEPPIAPPPPPASVAAAPAVLDPEVLARIDELTQRVDGVDQTVSHSSEQFAGQLAQLNSRVIAQAELGAQLSALRDRFDELQRDQPAADAHDPQLGQLAERIAANDEALRRTAEQVHHLEQRLDSVSTELTNQLSELGRDIDGLTALAGDGEPVEGESVEQLVEQLVDQLRTGQVKLANEQARYEIAFRQDLAALAEQVRRGK